MPCLRIRSPDNCASDQWRALRTESKIANKQTTYQPHTYTRHFLTMAHLHTPVISESTSHKAKKIHSTNLSKATTYHASIIPTGRRQTNNTPHGRIRRLRPKRQLFGLHGSQNSAGNPTHFAKLHHFRCSQSTSDSTRGGGRNG